MRGGIFDMDGLLFDTEKIYQEVWHTLARERGFTLPGTFASEICGKGEKQAAVVLRKYFVGWDPFEIIETCKATVFELERTRLELKPGAREILEAMKARGLRLAVASSSPMFMIKQNLELGGITELFDSLVSGENIPRGKPFPDIFLAAAESLQLPPEECWVFEDSLNGIRAGHAAGCKSVMIPDLVAPSEDIIPLCQVFPTLLEARDRLLN